MGIRDFFNKITESSNKSEDFSPAVYSITEKAKSVEDDSQFKYSINKDCYEHPFDYKLTRDISLQNGLVNAILNKYVDTLMGPGFHVKSDNEKAEKLIMQYIDEVNLPMQLKPAFKEALRTGIGPLEIAGNEQGVPTLFKAINSSTFYLKKDGNYMQKIGQDEIPLKKKDVLVFFVNKPAGQRYGWGIVHPNIRKLNDYLKSDKELHTLMERKANNPFHVIIGDREKRIIPKQGDVDAVGAKLRAMRTETEWCTDPYVEIKPLDTGNVGDKFSFVLQNDYKDLLNGFEIPEVVMGNGSIPEGLAGAQKELWDRTIQALREEWEIILENELFKKVLENVGINAKVEVYWDQLDYSKQLDEMRIILESLKLFDLDGNLRLEMEKRLAELLDLKYKVPKDIEKRNEDLRPQPVMPGQNKNPPSQPPKDEESVNTIITEVENISYGEYLLKEAEEIKDSEEELTVKEWVGYDYGEHINYIESFINSPNFVEREFKTFSFVPGTDNTKWKEFVTKYSLADDLSAKQINRLRNVLVFNFKNNKSLRDIRADIISEVKPGTLKVQVPELLDRDGNVVRKAYTREVPERTRASMMARVETIRASNQGTLNKFKSDGVQEVEWISSVSERTCPYCEAQNGKIMGIKEANETIPVHTNCRCTWVAYIRE